MKITRVIVAFFASVGGVIGITPLFLNSHYDVKVSQFYPLEQKENLFILLGDFKNHYKWNPWIRQDPNISITLGEPSGGKGGYYSWISQNRGTGKQTMVEFKNNEFIGLEFDFGAMGKAHGSYTLLERQGQAQLEWRFYGEQKKYFARFMTHFMDKVMTPIMEEGLKNLHKEVSQMPVIPSDPATIDTTTIPVDSIKSQVREN